MAKKKTATTTKAKAVRLDLTPADHERLDRAAKSRGLALAAYARQAVLERIKMDETGK